MTRFIFISVFILTFCLAAFAQENGSECPNIVIKVPENIKSGDSFEVSAAFVNSDEADKFNWIIIRDYEKASRINGQAKITIRTDEQEGFQFIGILAVSLDERCQSVGMKDVVVRPLSVGHPVTIDLFGKLSLKDENLRLRNIADNFMPVPKGMELLIYARFDKKTSPQKRKRYLLRFLKELTKNDDAAKSRITFLISESNELRFEFQFGSEKSDENYIYPDSLVIRGEDLEKLAELFK